MTSLVGRVRHRYTVAVAAHEAWNAAVIGVCRVIPGRVHAREILDPVVAFVADGVGDIELVAHTVGIVMGY